MPLDNDSTRTGYYASVNFDDIRTITYGIHSSLNGVLPSYRIVYYNTEAKNTNGETISDNVTVGYSGTADATTVMAGITKFGADEPDNQVTYLPGFNRDLNVSTTTHGFMICEVAPGATITVGTEVGTDAVGRATAGGGTGIIAVSTSTGSGTADNPEFIKCLVR